MQRLIDVIEQNLAKVTTVRQIVLEDQLATEGDVPSKFLPTSEARRQRPLKGLLPRQYMSF
jgi:hypothetical protein